MNALAAIAMMVAAATAPDVSVRVVVEPPVIPFHRQTEYTIVVEAPAEAKVSFPEMAGKFGGLAVYGTPERTRESIAGGRVQIVDEPSPAHSPIWPATGGVAPQADGPPAISERSVSPR